MIVAGQSPTVYGYDEVGNLAGYTYPNGVATALQYDPLNRLTNLASQGQQGAVASYAYTLGTAGNRTGVTELSGRTVAYGYDNLYRLTSETIANDLSGMNGATGYVYDAVGNRQQMTSTLPAIAPGRWNYDANDRLTSDQNDADGNITSRVGVANAYDFENHLVQHGFMTFVYDGDGNRVAKTIGGVTTNYLVDTLNPTGYAQVLDELQSNAVTRSYTWGLQLVSESQLTATTPPTNPWITSWYGLDGHGSVRYLTNSAGAVTGSYDYDAFGNLINSTGTTANNYLFAGEQFDPELGLYYNRARYLDVQLGRFWGMDTDEGMPSIPPSLHKYTYTAANPVNAVDPSGHDSMLDIAFSMAIDSSLNAQFGAAVLGAAGGTPAAWLVRQLVPPNVLASLANATPDAMLIGGEVQVNPGTPLFTVSGSAGAEFVMSLHNGESAVYSYISAGGTMGGSSVGVSAGGYVGLIWNADDAAAYTGVGRYITAPLGTMSATTRATFLSGVSGVSSTVFAGRLSPEYLKYLSALGSVSATGLSVNGSCNISWSPESPTFAVTVGASAFGSLGVASTQYSYSWSYGYEQYSLLTGNVNFK